MSRPARTGKDEGLGHKAASFFHDRARVFSTRRRRKTGPSRAKILSSSGRPVETARHGHPDRQVELLSLKFVEFGEWLSHISIDSKIPRPQGGAF